MTACGRGPLPRIEQAIENLVGNALRHTPPGGTITLGAAQAGGVATLSVSGTGVGIAPGHPPESIAGTILAP